MDFIQPRPLLKRKRSVDSSFTHPINRFRTFSEPHIDAATTDTRKPLPDAMVRVVTPSFSNMPNPLRAASGDQSSPGSEMTQDHVRLKSNPLRVAEDQLEKLQLTYDFSIVPQASVPISSFSTQDLTRPRNFLEDATVSHPLKTLFSFECDVLKEVDVPTERQYDTSALSASTHEYFEVEPVPQSAGIQVDLVDPDYSNKSSLPKDNKPLQTLETPSARGVEISSDEMVQSQTAPEFVQPTLTKEHENQLGCVDDEKFLEKVKVALKSQGKWKTANVGRRSARRIGQLLELVKAPNASEALFLTGDDASRQLECGNFFPGPIITENQQPLPLQTIAQFLGEFYDDSAEVWIQDPAILLARNIPHARDIKMGQLKQRFLAPGPHKARIPWNCLEMATHVEDGLRPAFLNNEDCRLLTKLKLPGSADNVARRSYDPGWKEVEKWALLAQGGALTEPHQDSHGYGTYITMNQGTMGFGWLSNPTKEERTGWLDDPATFTGGRWRYVVLKPGQTVYFPGGTVHFVFRLASMGDTLAFGGHVLRCSQIVRWAEVMLEEQANRGITNEDLTVSAPAYLERVEKFVNQALGTGEVERWGGVEAIETFLWLKAEFVSRSLV